jgi:transcriptional regulator with XRE-family HTH domain
MQSIGEIIKQQIKIKGLTVSEFARRINTNRNNAYDIFRRDSIDTALLQKISDALEYNFFVHFVDTKTNTTEPPASAYSTGEKTAGHDALLKEIAYLKQMIDDKNRIIYLLEERIAKAGV